EVDADEIAGVISRWTGIPVSRLLEGEIAKLLHMEERLHNRVIGQEDAVRAVSAAVRRSRAGLQDPNRPVGTFLLLGPTGVDKNELRDAVMRELDNVFRPEFLNRLDDIILFQSLTQEDIMRIVDIQLGRLTERLQNRRLTLELTADARRWLAERGYDPVFGAR